MSTCKIVVFEGPDCVGKGTQSKLLRESLAKAGYSVIRVEPSKEAHPQMKKLIYSMLDNGAAKRYPNVFQFVQFLNKVYFQTVKLPTLKNNFDVVILDRWSLSGYVYGQAEGINPWLNRWMYDRVKRPDVTLVFYGKSYKRSSTADDSYEKDTELQSKVAQAYITRCRLQPDDHVIINNDKSVEDVHKSVLIELAMVGIP